MNLVKVKLVKLSVKSFPHDTVFESHLLGKEYMMDLDTRETATTYNMEYDFTYKVEVAQIVEYGRYVGYLPIECMEIIESIGNPNKN